MTAAEHVRIVLGEFKRQGAAFNDAWARALQTLPRGTSRDTRWQAEEDLRCVQWAKAAWQAAYEGGGWKVDRISDDLTILAYGAALPWQDSMTPDLTTAAGVAELVAESPAAAA